MNDSSRALALAPDIVEEAVAWRRHLHQHPELAYDERQTSEFIASQLTRFGLKVHRGLAGTGVVGTLTRGTSSRAIGIRADMDALRIMEKTGAAHASRTEGLMHACGHDGHVAMALAAARVCAQLRELDGTVHFIFQPAEEGGAGARRMVDDGLFKLFPCEFVYGLHNWPALPLGTCVALDGAMMAANAVIEIEIHGRGCHGAMPHEGTDAVLAACQLVVALQTIVSRNIESSKAAVISVTQIRAGDSHNVIPDICVIRGTARWFDGSAGAIIERRLSELASAIASAFRCEAHVRFERRYPATINDPGAAQFVRSLAAAPPVSLRVIEDAQPSTAAEDFAFMLAAVPGCYFWLGAGKQDITCNLHSPRYDFNDQLLPLGASLWATIVHRSLANS